MVAMGVSYLVISTVFTAVSLIGLQNWTEISLEKFKEDGLIGRNTLYNENASRIVELLLRSHATIMLLAISIINAVVLLILFLKTIFFGELFANETRKAVERLVNYVIYKGAFLPLIIPPTVFQASLWLTWLTILCFLKIFQSLARDRLERLNASPSATPLTYFRVYSALLLVLVIDFLWIWFCASLSGSFVSSTYWLLFSEPLSIAFETFQAILVHGFQLLDIWVHHSASESTQRLKFFDASAGSLQEWKGDLVRSMGFFFDMMTLLMALGHYVLIWWLHGMAFHLIDAILFLNIRALLSAVVKRVKGFVKLKIALGSLHEALPDAMSEEIQAYDDDCAICREPMTKAKKLPCNHLFHLACLRSWLDQGLNEVYACPTCRKPLFVVRSETESSSPNRTLLNDEQFAHQPGSRLDLPNAGGHERVLPNENQTSFEANNYWSGDGVETSWLQRRQSQGLDAAGPSTVIRSAGLGRVQMMMRHLASVGETYAQSALEDTSWSLWPTNTSQATTSGTAFSPVSQRHPVSIGATHRRTLSHPATNNIANLLAMADTVREVLPHIPDEIIFQDLQQTNSVAVTINNLLQM